ncbi:hypothetical protein GXP71_11080 [Cellulomonas sp. H30R-01]|uniref:DUF5691 domain-containing protein n=2 Tax=Cellulomonas TaxID=1707 RepID=UPI00138B5EFE|nr:DUF5691 domain-containing protein [Cellulomonas sp. H30R-01]QHT56566.1 hypothetical protein GXP71_11080 [Cellulomonas sp. H30R-01]
MTDDLATAALLGTDRSPASPTTTDPVLAAAAAGLPERDDPATRLLDAAALAATARRATGSQVIAGPPPPPAPDETLPVCGAAAAAHLRALLAGGTEAVDLLALWLSTAAVRGLRIPPALVVPVLEAVAAEPGGRPGLRADALVAAGERGRWLAAQHPTWRALLPAPAPVDTGTVDGDDPAWRHGDAAERAAWLDRARTADPATARALVAEAWRSAGAQERATLVRALRSRLSPDDEPFLDAALADRSVAVRAAAVGVLAHLPSSAFVARCAERALTSVTITRRMLRDHLTVELPEPEPDDPFAAPALGAGAKAALLTRLVEVTPLSAWDRLGRDPGALAQLAAAADAGPLLDGWTAAAEREHDPRWARALLRASPGRSAQAAATLGAVLDPGDRADVVRAVTATVGATSAGQAAVAGLVQGMSGPWSEPLTVAVAEWAARQSAVWGIAGVLRRLGHDAEPTARTEALLRAVAGRAGPHVAPSLTRAADLVHERRTILEELT